MTKFFAKFPKIGYRFDGNRNRTETLFTNVLFRLKILEQVKKNIYAYYEIIIPEGETPTTIADKYYGDPEYHWIILLANDISDPLFDWPMTYRDFQKYIKSKYGSLAAAKTTTRHYLKTITRTLSTGSVDTFNFEIGADEFAATPGYTLNTFELESGDTLQEVVTTSSVSFYDYEQEINEKKRTIKIIKKEYVSNILNEFDQFLRDNNAEITRRYKRIV